MKNILISNDDGVMGPGILASKQALEGLANVVVVAPQENNSAVGRKVNIMKHMYLENYELADGSMAYGLSGTPADSVNVGINYVCDEVPDLVVTGINPGINISRLQITTSGTVCAAIEAVGLGIPAIACSLFLDDDCFKQDDEGNWYVDTDYSFAQKILAKLVKKVLDEGMPDGVDLFNLNIPSKPLSDKIKITRLADSMLKFNILERVDDDGNDTVMNVPELIEDYEEGTDGYCLLVERRPSLTPLNVHFGAEISNLEDWEF
ncbi:5'-nucleotidase SurE2 [Methanobrevibacter ruminantium M1]|uniref:5'-nucleotidase SurE n=1 Tax=Methanobrevibacter ruminantium (strain ATCC 35063 / DSM 1093 / JCM 13430 / OCM 146 / M1) TaxID=634498 RepID=D3E0M5_METRM|nr:5'/3'-nucleotidase SurE [Methanobrevibacter ruminantium]ADC46271.1 5'-nucleotidase SurE2 [Methanobrevibacter ruminantium M1]